MDRSLSPRDAAAKLGISADTLRRWEARGLIASDRTPGGQRRYPEQAVDALLSGGAPEVQATPPRASQFGGRQREADLAELDPDEALDDDEELPEVAPEETKYPSRRPPGLHPWDIRVHEERADLEIAKLRREREALLKADAEEAEQCRLHAEHARATARRAAEAEKQAAMERQREAKRIDGLRSIGRMYVAGSLAPPNLQAEVSRDVQSFITAERFPAWFAHADACQLIYARVQELLATWRAGVTARRAKEEGVQKLRDLLIAGRRYAAEQTAAWKPRKAERACKVVEREMVSELDADWTAKQVRAFVLAVLADWKEMN